MKINLIIPSFYPATVYGGPIFSTLHACDALSKLNNVTVYVSTTNANRDKKLDVKVNVWVKFNKRFFVKYYNTTFVHIISLPMFLRIWNDIKKADVVQIQPVFNLSSLFALVYSRIQSKPILLSPRGSMSQWGLNQGSRFKKLWLKLFISPINKYLDWHATSEAEKADILHIFPKSRVHIIQNGIDFDSFSKVTTINKHDFIKNYVGVNKNPSKIIISMGRLHKVKGFDILIKAFNEILKSDKSVVLLIAGKDVGEGDNLKALVQDLEIKNNVFFVGEVSGQAKVDFLGNADLFVLPSHTENFGNVYIESLAAGTPIVASKGTPWKDVEIADCGKWVENKIEDTTQAIKQMLKNDRKTMLINSRLYAHNFDWKYRALEFKKVFEKMILDKND